MTFKHILAFYYELFIRRTLLHDIRSKIFTWMSSEDFIIKVRLTFFLK